MPYAAPLDGYAMFDAGFHLHPALMDIATGWAMLLLADDRGAALWGPVSYGTVRVFAPPDHEVWIHVRLSAGSSESGVARIDITLADATGAMLAEIRDVTMRRQKGGLVVAPPGAAEIRFDEPTEAAPDMIAELRQVQPHGRYLLGGFSGGGITACEMAQRFRAAGEEVTLCVLIDTPLPRRRPLALRDRALIQWQELMAGGPLYPLRLWRGEERQDARRDGAGARQHPNAAPARSKLRQPTRLGGRVTMPSDKRPAFGFRVACSSSSSGQRRLRPRTASSRARTTPPLTPWSLTPAASPAAGAPPRATR